MLSVRNALHDLWAGHRQKTDSSGMLLIVPINRRRSAFKVLLTPT